EQGLVRLSNKATLVVFGIVNFILLPLALINRFTIPVLLLSSLLLPLIFYLNKKGKHSHARHFLLILLYGIMLLISLIRGLDSGILFLSIPTILLAHIFFYRTRSSYIHLTVLVLLILFVLAMSSLQEPLQPYPPHVLTVVYPIYLLIAITLTSIFADFFYSLARQYQKELLKLNSTQT
ncbi:hypothetical protein, partial [Cecembia lonarensis]